jgi:hypothetical protein
MKQARLEVLEHFVPDNTWEHTTYSFDTVEDAWQAKRLIEYGTRYGGDLFYQSKVVEDKSYVQMLHNLLRRITG